MSMTVVHASESRAETPESASHGRYHTKDTDRVSELESFLLIQVQIVVSGYCEDRSRLKFPQQLSILLSELI